MENLLKCNYTIFRNTATGKTLARTSQYSVPLHLHQHIDLIQPTTAFHRHKPQTEGMPVEEPILMTRGYETNQSHCNDWWISGLCVKEYYNVDCVGTGNTNMAVVGLLNLSASHTDAISLISYFTPDRVGLDFQDVPIGGGMNYPSVPSDEGNIDTQIALVVAYPNPVAYFATGPGSLDGFSDSLINLATYINSLQNPPSTVSVSYGGPESWYPESYLARICNEYMKVGARGVSLFFASGDDGVGPNQADGHCSNGFQPEFPASCPYVTTVGGTQRSSSGEIAAKIGIQGGSSGGGFSNYFPSPAYQANDVKPYLVELGDT